MLIRCKKGVETRNSPVHFGQQRWLSRYSRRPAQYNLISGIGPWWQIQAGEQSVDGDGRQVRNWRGSPILLEEVERILVPAFKAFSRTTALVQFGRDVRGDLNLIDFGLGPDKADPLVDTSVTMPLCVRYG
jgi:hypothetical protein